MKRQCSIDGCDRAHAARGYCEKHYDRWRKHGDPLCLIMTERGAPRAYLFDVVLAHDTDDCLIWPYGRSSGGYAMVSHDGKRCNATRVVCSEVHGPPPTPKHEAAHTCGRGSDGCCSPRHLVWKTHKENMADKIIHDKHNRGERHGNAKLTQADVDGMRTLFGVETNRRLARKYGVSEQCVALIRKGINWSYDQPSAGGAR